MATINGTDSQTTELLPCPFCGGEATAGGSIRQHYGEIYRVGCDKKGCAGWRYESVMYKSREAAIEAWNTRTPEQVIADILAPICVDEKERMAFERGRVHERFAQQIFKEATS